MFRIHAKHANFKTDKRQVITTVKSIELANILIKASLSKQGYFDFNITEYTQKAIKTGTSKSNTIKSFFSKKG